MSDDDDIELDYHYLTNNALRGVVRDVLSLTQELGSAPGQHHFYIEFMTRGTGVSIPERLLGDYPERMTIVLQHQFEDLEVDEEGFSVTLYFKRQPARLVVPFSAVTSFADPSVQFGLRFDAPPDVLEDEADDGASEDGSGEESIGDGDKVASLSRSRDGSPEKRAAKTTEGQKKAGQKDADPQADADDSDDTDAADGGKSGADIVSLDAFRKK